ncbi:MAG: BTAD domain-containing putative transcriptional regulator [Desulfobulbaceae bacterium]|nr:BTAD domain-containing putative transcriptional regulator [Desulfobulbaceae bacterium]
MYDFAEFQAKIPANKFYPPRVDASQCLLRSKVIDTILQNKGAKKQVILIETQAGQGKTTLIIQLLERLNKTFAWYQIGTEDSDPILLFNAILANLQRVSPGFSSPQLEQRIISGKLSPLELNNLANLMLADLDACLDDDFYCVFDDLHLLQDAVGSTSLLNYLFDTAPPRIHFILASRQPFPLTGKHLKYHGQLHRLTNSDLAMSESEITTLYQDILHISASPQVIHTIYALTKGWTMGVILAGHDMERRQTQSIAEMPIDNLAGNQGGLLGYFREEIFAQLPKNLHHPFLLLSFLDEIPVALASLVTGLTDIGQELHQLTGGNHFIRRLDAEGTLFSFHHLYQEFLQDRARHELEEQEIFQVLDRAASFSLAQEKPAQALRYLLKAGDLDAMEQVLAQYGMNFMATNQSATLASILSEVPETIILSRGWFSLFSALISMDREPDKCLPLLKEAAALFAQNNEGIGELLAISHVIHYHNVTSGVCSEGTKCLGKAQVLFDQVGRKLSDYSKTVIAINLANGFCFFVSDLEQANRFSSLAMDLACQHKAYNFQASALLIQGYEQMIMAKTKLCLEKIEQAYALIHISQLGTFNTMMLRFLQLNYLNQYAADRINYQHQKSIVVDIVGREILKQSIPGLFFYLFEMDEALGEGQNDRCLELSDLALSTDSRLLSPHIRSQVLQLKSLALALQQHKEEALAAAEESARLRIETGGLYFTINHKLCLAPVYGLVVGAEQALILLTEAIRAANDLMNPNQIACGLLYRAYFHLREEKKTEACADLEQGLHIMRRHRYVNILAFTPYLMVPLLSLAVTEKIEADYARHLAAERLDLVILDNGETIPLLNIKTLGRLEVWIKDESRLSSEDLTPTQRDLLSLLIASPNRKISQEGAQLALWPDSPPAKARAKFDSLLLRFRKTLAQAMHPHAANNYLQLHKGILCLQNCRVDAHDFLKESKQGLHHVRLKEYWQAGNAFQRAATLWQGTFVPEVTANDTVHVFRDQLQMRFTSLSLKWADILIRTGQKVKAISVLTNVRWYDGTNDKLVCALYTLHRQNSAAQAAQVIKQYEQALFREGYPPAEIKEMVADLLDSSTK